MIEVPDLIFVDCEGTTWIDFGRKLNHGLLQALGCVAEAGHPVVFYTGGDDVKYYRKFAEWREQFPESLTCRHFPDLRHKHDLRGAELLVSLDDTSAVELKNEYGFTVKHFINAKGKTDAEYYHTQLSQILGQLPPLRQPPQTSNPQPTP